MLFDELDFLFAPDSREAFSEQEEMAYEERMNLYEEAEDDGFFDWCEFDLGGEG